MHYGIILGFKTKRIPTQENIQCSYFDKEFNYRGLGAPNQPNRIALVLNAISSILIKVISQEL